MATVLKPEPFNELFTLYLNADGRPVQRALRDMTAGEVMTAINWQMDHAEALRSQAEAGNERCAALTASSPESVTADDMAFMDRQEALCGAASTELEKAKRLLELVGSQVPPAMKLGEGIKRVWPATRGGGKPMERTLMLFEMNEALRMQVVERLSQQIAQSKAGTTAALEKERAGILGFNEKMRSMGCPPSIAPSEFFPRRSSAG
jgi:hypothetical protein